MECPVIADPLRRPLLVARKQLPLDGRELVVSRYDAPLPLEITGSEGAIERVDSSSKRSSPISRSPASVAGATSKPRWPSATTKSSLGEPIEDLTQRTDAHAILILDPVERQPLPRLQPPHNDVGPDAAEDGIADRSSLIACGRASSLMTNCLLIWKATSMKQRSYDKGGS